MENNNENKSTKKVLITGCSSGFGLLTTVKAAQSGYDVIATMRNMDKAHYLTDALDQAGVTARIDRLDLTDPAQIAEIAEKYSPVDILINNAGILIMGSSLDITEDENRKIMETNYFGPVNLTRALIPAMIERKSGLIINVASLAGLIGHPFNAAYSSSKHALIGFSQSLSVELMPFDIKVVSVEPGYHKTEIIRANANLSENFYDRSSPFFQWNRGFLRLMMDRIIPNAGDPDAVVDKIIKIMTAENPKLHYVIGKDAGYMTFFKWLGLDRWFHRQVFTRLKTATRRENKREKLKKQKRKAARKQT